MAEKFWLEIPEHFPFVELSDFVVMPNHVHGIIIINKTDDRFKMNNETNIVDNGNIVGNNGDGGFDGNGGYGENGVTKNSRLITPGFQWQPRYHDHIIRNTLSFERIQNYIKNNPVNWKEDKFYE